MRLEERDSVLPVFRKLLGDRGIVESFRGGETANSAIPFGVIYVAQKDADVGVYMIVLTETSM